MKQNKPICRPGFTLLEALLAVALTAIIAGLIASAIDFHLRQLTVRRTQIEEAQIARAVLRRIADDLRAAVVYRPADFSSVEELNATMEEADALLSGEASLDDEDTGDGTTEETTAVEDLAASAVPSANPGLFGNQYEIQVDVSRIPRYEEFSLMAQYGADSQIGSLSDVKTISYFLIDSANASSVSITSGIGDPSAAASQGGLARRVVDRASTRYALENGAVALLDQNIELFAPEITAIQFAYFDGIEWTLEWDSELRGGIPLAVEITVAISPPQLMSATADVDPMDAMSQFDANQVYRLVVHLPNSNLDDLIAAEEAALGIDAEEGL